MGKFLENEILKLGWNKQNRIKFIWNEPHSLHWLEARHVLNFRSARERERERQKLRNSMCI